MRLELTGRHVDITSGIRRVVDAKLAKLGRILNDGAISAHVVLCREKTFNRAEVTIHLRDEKFLHAVGEGARWQTPLTQAIDRIAQQARTTKGKYQARKRQGLAAGARPDEGVASAPDRRTAVTEPPLLRMPSVLKTLRQRVRAMSVTAAIKQLQDGGVVIFRDATSSRLSVLYRAAGGDLTLVEADT